MLRALIRGLFHMGGVLLIAASAFFIPRVALLVTLGTVAFLSLVAETLRFRIPRLNRWFLFLFRPLLRGGERSRFTGAFYIFIASFVSFLVFERDIAVLALSFLAVGDATAALVGRYFGRTNVLGKTLEGDISCFATCLITGFLFYQAGLGITLPVLVAGAAVATLMESVPLPVNDNLTIPLVSGLSMTLVMLAYFS